MSRKTDALSALSIARNGNNTFAARVKAINEVFDLKKAARQSFESFLNEDTDELAKLRDELIECAAEEKADKKADASKSASDRGAITALCRKLLLASDDPYADIVAAVVLEFPEAKTTARSVASIASDMRKSGEKVAMRRKVSK